MGSPARPRSSRTAAWTSSASTILPAPCTQRCIRPANHARFNFLNPTAHDLYPDWGRGADDAVALLRAEAGRDPYDRDLTDLIGELSTRSEEFRARWADHNVRLHQAGTKRFHHPAVGELTLTFEMMELAADPGLNLLAFTAEPGTKSHEALNLLGSWAATLEQEQTAPTAGEA
jgi:MmyB-like transcription regulator ligand binding domain